MIITKQKEKNWRAMENPMSIILFVPLILSLHLLVIFFVVLSCNLCSTYSLTPDHDIKSVNGEKKM